MKLKDYPIVKYITNVLSAIDRVFNALLLGDGDETLSSRMGKYIRKNECVLCKFVCGLLNKIDPNHCVKNIDETDGQDALL